MAIQDCAAVALATFSNVPIRTPQGTFPLPIVMVAIAGAESAWVDNSRGDYGLSGPTCQGYTSWGLWQIHSVHSAYLTRVTGSANPCTWANWLYDPAHNAQAALAVLGSNLDLEAWTTWQTGAYLHYLRQAQDAVASVSASPAPAAGAQGLLNNPIVQIVTLAVGVVGTVLTVDRIYTAHQGTRNRRQVQRLR